MPTAITVAAQTIARRRHLRRRISRIWTSDAPSGWCGDWRDGAGALESMGGSRIVDQQRRIKMERAHPGPSHPPGLNPSAGTLPAERDAHAQDEIAERDLAHVFD